MSTITDWLMVGITVVYVIATIFICWANIKSANASKAQIEESKRQFEETQRLTTMPFLYLELTKDSGLYEELVIPISKGSLTFNRFSSLLSLKNIGNGTATNIIYSWRCNEKEIQETDCFPFNAVSANSSHLLRLFYMECAEDQYIHPLKAILELQYDDLLGHTYEQKFIFSLDKEVDGDILQKCEIDIPIYRGKLVYSLKKSEGDNHA